MTSPRPPTRASAGHVRVDWRGLRTRTSRALGMVASSVERLEVERKLRLCWYGPGRKVTGNISTLTALTQLGALPCRCLGRDKASSRAVIRRVATEAAPQPDLIWPAVQYESGVVRPLSLADVCRAELLERNSGSIVEIPHSRVPKEETVTHADQ